MREKNYDLHTKENSKDLFNSMQNENIWEGYSLPIVVDDNMKHNQKAENPQIVSHVGITLKNPLSFSRNSSDYLHLIDLNNKKSVFLTYICREKGSLPFLSKTLKPQFSKLK